jgi:hypothetical protein
MYCYSSLFFGAIGLINLPDFLPKPVFMSIRWVSCKQQIFGSTFLIHFAEWCLLMGELSSLTFSVNIGMYVAIPAI